MKKDGSFPLTAMETTPRWLLNRTPDGDVIVNYWIFSLVQGSSIIPGAYERREGVSNCTNHLLSNHTFSKTPNMVKRMCLR